MDPLLICVIAGAFAAAFAIGSVGFADALILNAIWLHFLPPMVAIPLVVCCGFAMHIVPLYKLRSTLDFSRLPPLVAGGLAGVPLGIWALVYVDPDTLKLGLGVFLALYVAWSLLTPGIVIQNWGGRAADALVGLTGGILGGLAGLSGVLPTLWTNLRGWPKQRQRGTFQPFVLAMHTLSIVLFAANGMITPQVLSYMAWSLPVILVGSWAGTKVYPYFSDLFFRRIILGLILTSAIALLF